MHKLMIRTAVAGLAAVALFAPGAGRVRPGRDVQGRSHGRGPGAAQHHQGHGRAQATYDPASKKLTYTVNYKDLSGPATAAHFHGPAAAGANAGVVVPAAAPLTSPIKGEATLTDAQAADLAAGRWYFNIHTAPTRRRDPRPGDEGHVARRRAVRVHRRASRRRCADRAAPSGRVPSELRRAPSSPSVG